MVKIQLENVWEVLDYVKDADGKLPAAAYNHEYRKICEAINPALVADIAEFVKAREDDFESDTKASSKP